LQPTIQCHRTLPLESLGSQQGIDEINQQAERDQSTQQIIQDHPFPSAMGLPLEPLTAHDIGQAAGEKDHRQDQKKDVEHV
jgi:hypothetical protein